jgi:hypothetical protein
MVLDTYRGLFAKGLGGGWGVKLFHDSTAHYDAGIEAPSSARIEVTYKLQ